VTSITRVARLSKAIVLEIDDGDATAMMVADDRRR
jgi:hypothetical protein